MAAGVPRPVRGGTSRDATVYVVQTRRTAGRGWCDVEVYGVRWLEEAQADAAQTARWLPEGAEVRVVLRTITDMPVFVAGEVLR